MDLVIRAAVIFLFIFLITRIAGRRVLSWLEPFDVILLVVLGDLGAPQDTRLRCGSILGSFSCPGVRGRKPRLSARSRPRARRPHQHPVARRTAESNLARSAVITAVWTATPRGDA
jgi:hypothetical protein